MRMVNELRSNHGGSTKHRRKPNGTLRHNTLIKAHLQSALPLRFPFVLFTFDACKLEEILTNSGKTYLFSQRVFMHYTLHCRAWLQHTLRVLPQPRINTVCMGTA